MLLQTASAATAITSCTTITSPGEYYLSSNIINSGNTVCIDITANNVVLDCQNNIIDGVDSYTTKGILIDRTSATDTNITIKNCVVTDWRYGIYLNNADNNTLTDNNVSDNYFGIHTWHSDNLMVKNNNVESNNKGICMGYSQNCIVKDNTMLLNEKGIYMSYCGNNNISANDVYDNDEGIYLTLSTHNIVSNNTVYDNYNGIYLFSSNNQNSVIDNNASENQYGIILQNYCTNNLVKSNIVKNNIKKGIYVKQESEDNTIRSNIVQNNGWNGIHIDRSNNNLIYNNYFDNVNNTKEYLSANTWNAVNQSGPNIIGGPYIGGNYFSDYPGNDTDGDGFGETHYDIEGGYSQDNLPLIPEVPTIFLSFGIVFLSLFARRANGCCSFK